MATFTITVAQNITALTGKTGGDVYNVNGGVLTIDTDSRYGLNQSTSSSLGAITISATLGGTVRADARKVRLIAYTGGTGNVPAADTVISQGGASGRLIGVWSALNAAPTAAGAAMPTTGFIKIRQWNDTEYAAGALTGIGATSSGASVVGWLELVGDEAATVTVPRLGLFEMLGEWYAIGDTSGVANQTFQLPTSGLTQYFAGVFIEKSVGSNDYEFYANAGSQTGVAADSRAKVCWISTAGLLRIGHNGTANAGFTPVAGLKIRMPNILTNNCTTAARTANALPNATLATRYDFTTTGGGVMVMDKVNLAWYPSFAQAFSVGLSNVGILEQLNISECASPLTLTKVGVGQTAAQAQVALSLTQNFAGGTLTDCHWTRATLAASGAYTSGVTDCAGFTFINDTCTALTAKGNATSGNWLLTRASNILFTAPKLVNGRMVLVTCSNVAINNTTYIDRITGTTTTTSAEQSYCFELQSNCLNTTISGLSFGGLTNVQPYLGVLNIAAAGVTNTKLRNIGTRASPLNLGSTNNGAYLVVLATAAAANTVKVQRCYVSNTRTSLFAGDNSSTNIVFENCAGDFADALGTPMLNAIYKGIGATLPLTAQTACYGAHWVDMFTSATVGRIGVLMNEKTAIEPSASSYTVLAGTPRFTSAGGLVMAAIGDSIEFTMSYFALGHTSFQNATAVMAGGTIGNYTLQYQLNKNDGAGFGTLKTLNGANLSAETGIDPAKGVKLKIRITTATANTAAITSLYVLTNSSAAAQDNLYPLEVVTLTLTGLQTGSDVVILQAGTTSILESADSVAGSSYGYTYSTLQDVDIGIIKQGFVPLYVRGYTLTSSNAVLPIAQTADRNYI
jgi:hypothetical protein